MEILTENNEFLCVWIMYFKNIFRDKIADNTKQGKKKKWKSKMVWV